ncbi:phosphotransferase [Amycolatopsis anabasis]|uniref:phosphotransferase n=1 Tax=Amycolatopsis anabasis TaxID=1840409 RepID=UPI00131BA461|nr:phosphotransferase [Amycolatopsis anabasis]
MTDRYTRDAIAAAREVAARFGLPADPAEVLHARSNVLVRLGAVVARVPATTRLTRPGVEAWLRRDVALSAYLAGQGVRVVSPTADPPPGPHFAGGLPVTLWHFTPHDPDYRFRPAEVAESLAALHEALRGYPGELPANGPLVEIGTMLDRLFGDDPAPDQLWGAVASIATSLPDGPEQPLHGDAHPGNLIATPDGPCWLDFEDTWHGPLGWDLACLATTPRLDGTAALAAYPDAPPAAELAPFVALRELFGVCWRFAIARRFPDRQPEAESALAAYLSGS